jgi:hypothetical protein
MAIILVIPFWQISPYPFVKEGKRKSFAKEGERKEMNHIIERRG